MYIFSHLYIFAQFSFEIGKLIQVMYLFTRGWQYLPLSKQIGHNIIEPQKLAECFSTNF